MQSANAEEFIMRRESGNVTDVNFEQPIKALLLTVSTPLWMTISVKAEQLINACTGMLVSFLLIVT